jgi:hypothetical protein
VARANHLIWRPQISLCRAIWKCIFVSRARNRDGLENNNTNEKNQLTSKFWRVSSLEQDLQQTVIDGGHLKGVICYNLYDINVKVERHKVMILIYNCFHQVFKIITKTISDRNFWTTLYMEQSPFWKLLIAQLIKKFDDFHVTQCSSSCSERVSLIIIIIRSIVWASVAHIVLIIYNFHERKCNTQF